METTTRKRQEVTIPGGTVTVIARRRRDWSNRGYREYTAAPRMYVSVKDESLLDNLVNRKRRPYNVYKTLIHSSGLDKVLNLSRLSWSQYAGCSCPCSPGFILDRQSVTVDGETFDHFDIWLTLDGAPAVDERKAPRVI